MAAVVHGCEVARRSGMTLLCSPLPSTSPVWPPSAPSDAPGLDSTDGAPTCAPLVPGVCPPPDPHPAPRTAPASPADGRGADQAPRVPINTSYLGADPP